MSLPIMLSGFHGEPLLAATYALFLVGVAFILELAARLSQQRSHRYEHSGFTYRRRMDLWECPAGQQLLRSEIDHQARVIRYRAVADACNSCALKANCTDSDEGRIIERHLDAWIGNELQRFHRGISLTLLLLAAVILIVEAVRYESPSDLALVCTLLAGIGIAGTHMFSQFLNSSGPRRE
jgi:hypothetical protein